MSEIIFERKASTLEEIDSAFVKTALACLFSIASLYFLLKMKGLEIVNGKLWVFIILVPIICMLIFALTESQKHTLRFSLQDEELMMEYETADGEMIYLVDASLNYWWTYRKNGLNTSSGNSESIDVYMQVTGSSGETVVLRDALMLGFKSIPKNWSYSHEQVDEDLLMLETSKLEDLAKAIS